MAKALRFTTDAALVAWMEDEYLSEITLEDVDPKPGAKVPPEVRFTWWLSEGSARVPYRVHAKGVTAWSLDGEHDERRAIGMTEPDGKTNDGIHLEMQIPGELVLRCAKVEITRGRKKKLPFERHPPSDYSYFHVYGTRVVSTADVLSALGAPARAKTKGDLDFMEISVGGKPWIEMYGYDDTPGGFHFNIVRKEARAEEWERALELPTRLAPTRVMASYDFDGTDVEWSTMALLRSERRALATRRRR